MIEFFTQNDQGGTMHHTLKDHQGSLAATVCGNTVERLWYDAWGCRCREYLHRHLRSPQGNLSTTSRRS
ncbi:MAG: hypothetical protein K6A94_08970 [Bacteroidales bacterium]|nr:hypothetical protein [Bacteroidales bacterium]